MPWKLATMSDMRLALVLAVRVGKRAVKDVAAEFGVSRKTAFKWLARHDQSLRVGEPVQWKDRSRRPHTSPLASKDPLVDRVLELRDRHRWGPRKIHARLRQQGVVPLVSARTVGNILRRSGRVVTASTPVDASQRFERPEPNQLWQIDHKGPIEIDRRRLSPFTVIDDHSRWCLAFRLVADKTTDVAFGVLWELFGEVGMPLEILSDRAFGGLGTPRPIGLSRFDAKLVRLGIKPTHGRPHHPQTQGKVEAFHRTSVRELIDFNARRQSVEGFNADAEHWRTIYNTQRPHEALGDVPPLTRWRPSPRARPATLPAATYDAGILTRKVSDEGLVRYRGVQILVGRGIAQDYVAIEEDERELRLRYAWKTIRVLPLAELTKDHVL